MCRIAIEGYGISTLYKKEVQARVQATTSWRPFDLDKELHILAPTVGVLSDIHCPIHSEKWLLQAITAFKLFDVKHVIVNGDFLDANQISRHAGSYYRRKGELADDFNAAESVLKLLVDTFDHVYFDMGNHDMRLLHKFAGEVGVSRIWKMFGDHEGKVTVTSRSYCKVNENVTVCHPRQYSRIRGSLAQKLSQRWQRSILTGHQHHSTMSSSPDGKWQACDVGAIVDVELQDYVRNELSDHVEPQNGFAIIFGNKIVCFDKHTAWDLFHMEAP